jgi:hypothetical protein
MASNGQESVVAPGPELVVAEMPLASNAAQTQDAEARQGPIAQLRQRARAAVRSWPPGRRAWDRVVAWLAAIRAARGSTSQAPPTGD